MRKKVAEADAKVEEFRSRTNLFIGTNNTSLSNQTLGESNRDLAAARSQKADLEAKARVLRDLLKRGGPLESDVINGSELLRRLNEQRVTLSAQLAEQSSTLLDNHPRIKELKAQIAALDRQIRDEAQRLARSLENDAKIAGARVEQIGSSLDQLKRQAATSNEDDVQLRALQLDAKSQRDLLESYLAKYRDATARDSIGAVPPDSRIISRALVSNTPYFPKKMPIVLIATLATLFISAGFVTTGELLAGNVYRPEDAPIEPVMASPVVAPVAAAVAAAEPAAKRRWMPALSRKPKPEPVVEPPVAAAATADAPPVAPAAPQPADDSLTIAEIADALREAGEAGRRIAVIGMVPGIGTTATALGLARTLADHARVMLIELALERPGLAAITTDPRMPGVADLVRGTASFGQIITRDRFSKVQVIAAGRVGADAAAAYGSERLRIGIEALSRAYDHVVIDAGALPNVPADQIARLAPCGVLVASGQASAKADAVRDLLGNAGFDDIAVFGGTAPAIDPAAARGVAA
jgi:Mrp family chromosome partitioning ATPase